MAMELLDLRPVSPDYIGVGSLILREELHDVVEFDIIAEAWENFDRAQRTVAVINAFFQRSAETAPFFLR